MKRRYLLLFCLISFINYCYCQERPFKPIIISGGTQGTYYRITYYAVDSVVGKSDVETFLENFLRTASIWDENSIISRINRNEQATLNNDFVTIFNTAGKISEMTNGAFDITVGNFVNAWGFGAEKNSKLTPETVDSLLKFTGYKNIDIIDGIVVKKFPEITINFNAIAKGYSVDLLSQLLLNNGIENFVVDIGGEVRVSGKKPDGSLWNIGIEKPSLNDTSERKLYDVVRFTGKSMATSGTYRKYREKDGVRYSHTIDPQTGYPVSHTLLSATVIADNCITADALATAFMVMGERKAMEFLKSHPQYEGYFIFSGKDGGMQVSYTEGFRKIIIPLD